MDQDSAAIWRWTPEGDQEKRADQSITDAISKGRGTIEPDDFKLESVSRARVQKWLAEGRIGVGGVAIRKSEKLKAGVQVQILVPTPAPLNVEPENIPLDVLHEDEDLIVINKPSGMITHPTETVKTGTLVNALLSHVKNLKGIGDELRPGIVHRLDRFTSGVMVSAKSAQAHHGLVHLFSNHDLNRQYEALCFGVPAWKRKSFESLIGRNPKDRKKMSTDVEVGKRSRSDFEVLETFSDRASLIQATLHTGRTHQVRVHLTALGHSIFGDPTYGVPSSNHTKFQKLRDDERELVSELPGQALHAKVLEFIHPISGKQMKFETPMPTHMKELYERFKSN